MTERSKTASPDFGYTEYHDREADIANMEFDTSSDEPGWVVIHAYPKGQTTPVGNIHAAYFDDTGKSMYIIMVSIEAPWKGTGLGQILYDKLIEKAKSMGVERLYAGNSQTADARTGWNRLAKRYTVKNDIRLDRPYVDLTAITIPVVTASVQSVEPPQLNWRGVPFYSSEEAQQKINDYIAKQPVKGTVGDRWLTIDHLGNHFEFNTPEEAEKKYQELWRANVPSIESDRITDTDRKKVKTWNKPFPYTRVNPKHYPAFKAWFEGSKVVDDYGSPKMVFHVTNEEFDVFNTEPRKTGWGALDAIGAWFAGNEKLAQQVYNFYLPRRPGSPKTMPVYLSIKNPLQVSNRGVLEAVCMVKTIGNVSGEETANFRNRLEAGDTTLVKEVKASLIAQGYDGIHILKDSSGDAWVAFYPNQIKSALVNSGDFSKEHDSITASSTQEQTELPTISFKKLWHVGTMDISKKQPNSHEGQGLSVSTHPEAWEKINEFTAGAHWELIKPGNEFLNFHAMSVPQKEQLIAWGVEQGYVQPQVKWRTYKRDEDGSSLGYFEFDTLEEALEEAGYKTIEEAKEDDVKIKKDSKGVSPTPKFYAKMSENFSQAFVLDFLAVVYAEDVLHLDGVWWADRLSVSKYSAPRGVIFNSMLPSWTKSKAKEGAAKTAGYTAYVLTPESREAVLKAFPPKFPDVTAHHVTHQFGGKEAPEAAVVTIEGYASSEGLEALVVAVNGNTSRPDGNTYHITLSLDRSKGFKPMDSKRVIKEEGWTPVETPFEIQTMPQKVAAREIPERNNDYNPHWDYEVNENPNPERSRRDTPEDITETPTFQAWFMGSKVVDDHGRPLRVYHGTKREFDEFDTDIKELGSHFGTIDHANKIVSRGCYLEGARVLPCYLSIKNPLRLRDTGRFYPKDLVSELVKTGVIPKDKMKEIAALPKKEGNARLKKELISAGYDGVVYLNRREGTKWIPNQNKLTDDDYKASQPQAVGESWIAFFPNQIKSAIGNSGGFSTRENNITASPKLAAKYPTPEGLTFKVSGSPRFGFLIKASLENEVVGHILLTPYTPLSPNEELSYFVGDVKVEEAFRDRGVGLILYKKAIQLAQKYKAVKLYQGTPQTEAAAVIWKRLAQEYPVEVDDIGSKFIPISKTGGAKTADGEIPSWQQFVKRFSLPTLIHGFSKANEPKTADEIETEYNGWVNTYSKMKFPLTVWRVVTLPNGLEDLRVNPIGVYWSWNIDSAEAMHGTGRDGGNNWLLEARIERKDVDWWNTLSANLHPYLGEDECEITLKHGAKIQLIQARSCLPGEPNSWLDESGDSDVVPLNKVVTTSKWTNEKTASVQGGSPYSDIEKYRHAIFDYIDNVQPDWASNVLSDDASNEDWNHVVFSQQWKKERVPLIRLEDARRRPMTLFKVNPKLVGGSSTPEPVLVDDDYSVIDGMRRVATLLYEGATEIDVLRRVLHAMKTASIIGPVYHGTTYDFDEFKRNKGLRSGFLGMTLETDVWGLFDNKKVTDALRYLGFDGAKVPEGDDGEFGGESYCVLTTNQVKILSNVDIDRKRTASDNVFYHGTRNENVESVLKNGIIPSKWSRGYVYLSKIPATAHYFGDSGAVNGYTVFKVTIPSSLLGEIEKDPIHYWAKDKAYRYKGNIPPAWLSISSVNESSYNGGMGVDDYGHHTASTSPQFDAWFAGSKVVDNKGNPLVMYHATQADIGEFRPFTHFGTQAAANERHDTLTDFYDNTLKSNRSHGSNIMPVYLSIKNPLRLPDLATIDLDGNPMRYAEDEDENHSDYDPDDDDNQQWARGWESEDALAMTCLEMGVFNIDEYEETYYNDKAVKLLEQKGYDGIVYKNAVEDKGMDSWINFRPDQVKSALGNGGEYDPNNHSIIAAMTPLQKWFKGSKIVDAQGNPLKVYHGTNQSFDTFDAERGGDSTHANSAQEGFWFAAHPTVASEYADFAGKKVIHNVKEHEKKYNQLAKEIEKAERKGDWETYERLTIELETHELSALREAPKGMNVMPVYLRMVNPKVVETNGGFWNLKDAEGEQRSVSSVIAEAKKEGHDGVVFKGVNDSPGASGIACDHFVVFSPNQVKSAIGNSGEFDKKNPSIIATMKVAKVYDVFHGTDEDFDEFSDEFKGCGYGKAPVNMMGFHFTDSETVAKTFGNRIIHAKVKIDHPYIIDAKGRAYDEYKHTINAHLDKIDKGKCDGIIIKNYQDAGRYGDYILSNHYIPFSTSQIQIMKPVKTAMPHLPDDLKSTVFYHGTSGQDKVDVILRDGLQPNKKSKYRGQWKSQKGRVYLTRHLGEAVYYAMYKNKEEFGYVFAFSGNQLEQDVNPDEDIVGRAAWWLILYDYVPNLETPEGFLEFARDVNDKTPLPRASGPAGKLLLDIMPETMKAEWLRLSRNVAYQGWVMPTACWRIRCVDWITNSIDDSNFFEFAEVVPLSNSKTAALYPNMYHGTGYAIKKFDSSWNSHGLIFFTPEKELAESFAKKDGESPRVYRCTVDVNNAFEPRNPQHQQMLIRAAKKWNREFDRDPEDVIAGLEDAGYDFLEQYASTIEQLGFDAIWMVENAGDYDTLAVFDGSDVTINEEISSKIATDHRASVDLRALYQEWRKQAEEVAATNPPPLPNGHPWIPWELWKDKPYPVGTARVGRSGAVETVTVLPIDKLEWIQEKVNSEDVKNYRENRIWEKAYPSVREFTNRYEIVDGHHRVQAAKDAGEREIKVWLDSRERSDVYAEALRKLGYDPGKIAAKKKYTSPYAFYIEVPKEARDHFWEEPPEHNREFWAFRSRPRVLKGERVIFTMNKKPVAETICDSIEKPGESKCEATGKYERHWKLYWSPKNFKKYAQPKAASSTKYYHSTDVSNRKSILKSGLLASKSDAAGLGGFGGVFFHTKLTPESRYTDTWEADLTGYDIEPDETTDISGNPEYDGDSWWVVYKDVPPERLKLVTQGKMLTASEEPKVFTRPYKEGDDDQQRYKLVLKLDDDPNPIGFLECIAKPDHLKIHDVNIQAPFRNKGYGKVLYRAALDLARSIGLPEIRSDYGISPDAKRVWDSLKGESFKDYPSQVYPTRYRLKASGTIGGDEVLKYMMKLNHWTQDIALQVLGVDGFGSEFVLREYPLSKLKAGDDYNPARADAYAKLPTPFPPIVLGYEWNWGTRKSKLVIKDGNHRVDAAKMRGDKTIKAYVQVEDKKETWSKATNGLPWERHNASNLKYKSPLLNSKIATDPDRPGFLFPEMEPDMQGTWYPPNSQPENEEDERSLEERLDAVEGNLYEVEKVLKQFGARKALAYPEGALYTTEDAVIDVYNGGEVHFYNDVQEFVSTCSVEEFFSDAAEQFNKEFWEYPRELYHATDSENLDSIMKEGLLQANDTRGLSNRGVYSAVFTTENIDALSDGSYGDTILSIDMEGLKESGIDLPYVSREPDIEEGELRGRLAHVLHLDDYSYDYESGMDAETVIVHGSIPPQFLHVVE